MNKECLKAYGFYKRQHPNCVILFHVGEEFWVFQDDAFKLAEIDTKLTLYINCDYYWCRFSQDILENIRWKLQSISGLPITIIEFRQKLGSLTIPKVNLILRDFVSVAITCFLFG